MVLTRSNFTKRKTNYAKVVKLNNAIDQHSFGIIVVFFFVLLILVGLIFGFHSTVWDHPSVDIYRVVSVLFLI